MTTRSGIWNQKQIRDAQAVANYAALPQIDSITGDILTQGDSNLTLFGVFGTLQGTVRFISGATVVDVLSTPNSTGTQIVDVAVPSSIYNLSVGTSVSIKFIVKGVESNTFVKSVVVPTAGQTYGGGFYAGTIDIGGGVCYYLVVAPNSTGCAACQWKTAANPFGTAATNTCNGFNNTYTALNNANHPAGNWTATRTINGFSDWYLPAVLELVQLYDNKNGLPSGEEYAAAIYWSSSDQTYFNACNLNMSTGCPSYQNKTYTQKLRAIRRIPI